MTDHPAEDARPRFTPDGRSIIFSSKRHDLDSGREKVLVDWDALNCDPAYSPDGGEPALVSTLGGGEFAVYRIRLSDGKSWRVTGGKGVARHADYRP